MFDPTDKQPTINHSLDLPIQELAHSYPPQQERVAVSTKDGDNPNLILKGKALAIAFIGLLSAVFLVSNDPPFFVIHSAHGEPVIVWNVRLTY